MIDQVIAASVLLFKHSIKWRNS